MCNDTYGQISFPMSLNVEKKGILSHGNMGGFLYRQWTAVSVETVHDIIKAASALENVTTPNSIIEIDYAQTIKEIPRSERLMKVRLLTSPAA